MTTEDIFRRVIAALDAAQIPYMLTGSFASSFHGVSRGTQDIDIVIAPSAEQLRAFVKGLPETEYYADLDAALDALRRQTQFNVIDFATGWKVDLIIRKARPFSREEFERRRPVDLFGVTLFVASAEDVIIAKLEWAKLGESRRQLDDVAGIVRARPSLDGPYIERWVRELDLDAQWRAALALTSTA